MFKCVQWFKNELQLHFILIIHHILFNIICKYWNTIIKTLKTTLTRSYNCTIQIQIVYSNVYTYVNLLSLSLSRDLQYIHLIRPWLLTTPIGRLRSFLYFSAFETLNLSLFNFSCWELFVCSGVWLGSCVAKMRFGIKNYEINDY